MAKVHRVAAGDCITSISFGAGFYWKTLWEHADNGQLSELRKDPNVLFVGDQVVIPERVEKVETRPPEARHRFRLKGVPAMLRLRVMKEKEPEGQEREPDIPSTDQKTLTTEDPEPPNPVLGDEPRAGVPYMLVIDGRLTNGTTDSEGKIEVPIPPNARRGELIIDPGTPEETRTPLDLGVLDPITEIRGVSQRLANLSMGCEPTGKVTPEFDAAVLSFQRKHGLVASGELDAATRAKIQEVHGS